MRNKREDGLGVGAGAVVKGIRKRQAAMEIGKERERWLESRIPKTEGFVPKARRFGKAKILQ